MAVVVTKSDAEELRFRVEEVAGVCELDSTSDDSTSDVVCVVAGVACEETVEAADGELTEVEMAEVAVACEPETDGVELPLTSNWGL